MAIFGQRRPQLVEPGRVGRDRRAARSAKPGCHSAEQVEQHAGPDHEHAGVPAVAPGRRGTPRPRRPTASRRTPRPRCAPAWPGSGVAEVDVAERRSTGGRLDAERDQPVVARDRRPPGARRPRTPPGRRSRGRRRRSPSRRPGRRRSSTAAASPIAAIESRGDGSAITASGPTLGQLREHRLAVGGPGDHDAPGRRPAAPAGRRCSWSSDRPLPVRSCRNFGDADRDSGQSRVPAPPAGITAQKPSTLVRSVGMVAL